MKKTLMSIAIICISILSYSQKTDSLPIPDTAKLTLSKVYSDVKSGIEGLSKSLKVPAQHVYGIMVKQQVVDSITWLVANLLVLLLTMTALIYWIKDKKTKDEWFGVPLIGILIFFILLFCTLSTIVAGFVNPEYGAIKEIISFVK